MRPAVINHPEKRSQAMNPDLMFGIPADEYHAASRTGQYMSSHLLADFRESPAQKG